MVDELEANQQVKKAITLGSIIARMNRNDPNGVSANSPDPESKFGAIEEACNDSILKSLRQMHQDSLNQISELESKTEKLEVKTGESLPQAPEGKRYVKTFHDGLEGKDTYRLMTPAQEAEFHRLGDLESNFRQSLYKRADDLMKEKDIKTNPLDVLRQMDSPISTPKDEHVASVSAPHMGIGRSSSVACLG
jgi:hypothetical protein